LRTSPASLRRHEAARRRSGREPANDRSEPHVDLVAILVVLALGATGLAWLRLVERA
jgi:hypothetical protein